jgi:hypothetical protein
MIRYVLIDAKGECTVYNILSCAELYQKIRGGVIKEVSLDHQ